MFQSFQILSKGTRNQERRNCAEDKMNYHSSEDCFLKVEKRFLIMVGHAPYYRRGDIFEMTSLNLYSKRKIVVPNSSTGQNINMEPHGQSPWFLHEIPAYAWGAQTLWCAKTKASAGYPPVAKSAVASTKGHESVVYIVRIHPWAEPVVFCEGG